MGRGSKRCSRSKGKQRSSSRRRTSSRKRSKSQRSNKKASLRTRSTSHRKASPRKRSKSQKRRSKSRGKSRRRSASKQRSPSMRRSASRRVLSRHRSKSQEKRSPSPRCGSRSCSAGGPPKPSAPTSHSGDTNKAEVLERSGVGIGEKSWQAEILVPQGGVNHAGRERVFTIRGPPRRDIDQAERDAHKLNEAAAEGAKAVRALANQLHRS